MALNLAADDSRGGHLRSVDALMVQELLGTESDAEKAQTELRAHTLYMHEYGSLRLGTVLNQCAVQRGGIWFVMVIRVGELRIHLVNAHMESDDLSGYLTGLGTRDKVMIAGDWNQDPTASKQQPTL